MPESRFTDDQLVTKALTALEETLDEARAAPVKCSASLRFTLAWLANRAENREPFDAYWRAVSGAGDAGVNPTIVHLMRASAGAAALAGIYREVGRERVAR